MNQSYKDNNRLDHEQPAAKKKSRAKFFRERPSGSAIFFIAALVCFVFFASEIAPYSKFVRLGDLARKDYIATDDSYDCFASKAAVEKAIEHTPNVYDEDDEAFRSLQFRNERFFDALDNLRSNAEGLRRQIIQSSEKDDDILRLAEGNLSSYEWKKILGENGLAQLGRHYEEWFKDEEISRALALSDSMYNSWTREITRIVTSQQRTGIMDDKLEDTREKFVARLIDATPLSMQSSLEKIGEYCLLPTMFVNEEKTEAIKQEVEKSTHLVYFEEGSVILKKGSTIDEEVFQTLSANGMVLSLVNIVSTWLASLSLYMILIFLILAQARESDKSIFRSFKMGLVYILILAGTLVIVKTFFKLSPFANASVLGVFLVAQLYGMSLGNTFIVLVTPVVMVMSAGGDMTQTGLLLQTLSATGIGLFAGVSIIKRATKRSSVLVGSLATGFGMLCINAFSATIQNLDVRGFFSSSVISFMTCLAAGVIVLGIMPLFEVLFDFSTPFRLREYCDFNHPVLRRLMIEAPGTYSHSIMVANLCEACANAIGADPILARVGAYFHDIGKLNRPFYFSENQTGINPHDDLDPITSAKIILAHVSDGLVIAKNNKVPVDIHKHIREHHGDTVVASFYYRALENSVENIEKSDFQYPGPKPGTKETGVLMICDSVEAAVKSIKEPTKERISDMIDKVLSQKILDAQLSESGLDMREIEIIRDVILGFYKGYAHKRIEYPNIEELKRELSFAQEIVDE